ncbi:MAG: phospho-sugar mutase, partial [Clostridia bacterium]|nr:phospho-sugar mutase [Clostridia bacterium]
TRGISLLDKLSELYSLYGYVRNAVYSFEFDGSSGMHKMQELMKKFRKGLDVIGGRKVEKSLDYGPGYNGLPKADVLQYFLEDGSAVIIRPSGTEPKLKIYVTASGSDETAAKAADQEIVGYMKTLL